MTSPSSKSTALEQIAAEIAADTNLPLRSVATNPVPGEGNPDAEVLFIGEAPGKEEDLQGRPFVGAAGKLLNQLLESIGYSRERRLPAGRQVFIANILKHRPPGNRDPLPEEIAAYTPYLARQIEIINPLLIVTLGRFSMTYLLGEGFSITKIHGQPKRKNSRVIMPVYHPAAALYRRDWQPVLAADFQKIPKLIELIKQGQLNTPSETSATAAQQGSLL
jgi:uracil-DNA glycosylase family 4